MCQIQYLSDSSTFKLSHFLLYTSVLSIMKQSSNLESVILNYRCTAINVIQFFLLSFHLTSPLRNWHNLGENTVFSLSCSIIDRVIFHIYRSRLANFKRKTSILTRFSIFCKTVGETVVLTGSIAAIRSNGKRDEGL